MADQNNWDLKLNTLVSVLNSTTSASRQQSPYFLTFLQHPRFPYNSFLNDRTHYKEDSLIAHKLNMQASLIKQVEKHFHEAFLQAKTQFDKKVAIREFPLGCKVFVYTTQRGQISKKLHKPYKGPFTCIGHSQNNNLILRQPQSSKLLHVHKNSCKLGYWRHTNIQLWDPSPPPTDEPPAANPVEIYPFLDDDDLPLPLSLIHI